jgi:hypothetical protein
MRGSGLPVHLVTRLRKAARVGFAALALLVSACAPTRYRLQPYRDSPSEAQALSQRASQICFEHRGGVDMPPYTFTSDGCSMWPDCRWVDCCVEHDIAYWCGGSSGDRKRADQQLRQCVAEHGPAGMGTSMYVGVRAGGIPWQPFPWRWAYGWKGIRGYEQLDEKKTEDPHSEDCKQ